MDRKNQNIKIMDKEQAIKFVERYVTIVSNRYAVKQVFLFGSIARGNNLPDSDIDLAFVFPKVDDIIDLQIELLKMRSDDELCIEPHPFCQSEFDFSNPVAAEVIKHGIELDQVAV